MNTEPQRTCSRCGNEFSGAMEFCPVCMLRKALAGGVESGESSSDDTSTPTSEEAVHDYLETKQRAKLSERHLADIKQRLRRFVMTKNPLRFEPKFRIRNRSGYLLSSAFGLSVPFSLLSSTNLQGFVAMQAKEM